ncbi:hypothetical protein [Paenibacillus senegalensis]|uniref:hypothetical protein n=1 Tax=Paenibacillus senegalensis TaxID=1465766 RepID=UPI000289486A|nr:hypothetical protein [Paenibacillus senegalensis]
METHKLKGAIRRLRDKQAVPRLSFYRMVKGPEFAELHRFYEEGIGIQSQIEFEALLAKLEQTYCP